MSGAEAVVVVLGVISSIISIVDGTKQIYDAATNVQGLPEAFRDVAGRLPIVRNILDSARKHIDKGDVDENSCKAVKHVVGACEEKAKKLDELFHKAIPADGASDLKRYYKAVKAYGKGNEVENLMKGMLEDVQLLACEHGMKTATKAQQEQIDQTITEVIAIAPSVPEQVFHEAGFTTTNAGPGTQFNAQGEYIAQGNARQYVAQDNARQYNSAGGAMHFDVHFKSSTPRSSDTKVTSQSLPSPTPAFFGREPELKAINDCLLSKDPGQKVVALTGIGGLGKTQIALHIWNTNAMSYRSRVWIDATSPATVLSSFREVALAVGDNVALGCNDIISKQPMMAVKSWLALADNTKWLLVIDNVEDLDCDYSLQDIIPKCDHGAILVTTTQSETARVLGALNVEVGTIEKDAGAAILRRRFKRKTCTDEEKKLTDNVIEALHGVPLAIEQAGAYLQFNPSLTTNVLKQFLAKLSSPSTQADILAKIPKRSMWFYEKHRSVIDTFSLLKASLARNSNDALNILLISAFLAQGEIPLSFLTQPVTRDGASSTIITKMRATYEKLQDTPPEPLVWLRRITADESIYYMALETLEQFCCVKRRLALDECTYLGYSMHNVIRHWCQETLNLEQQAEWTILAAFQLCQCLQLDNVSILSYQNYSRHVGHVNKVLLEPECASLVRYPNGPYWWQAYMAACVWARFYQRQRRFDLARRMVEVIILYEKSIYDSQWPSQRESLETLHLEATILWEEGDFSNAIQRYRDLLQACDTHLGHFDDLTIKVSQELRKVQDRSKRHLRDLQMATCIVEPGRPAHREEGYISSSGETSDLQRFLLRYSDPTVAVHPLHEAASSGNKALMQLLLENGADIKAKDSNGQIALHTAVNCGHEAIIQLLLEKGADIEAKTKFGLTALHNAVKNRYEALVQLLLEKGADIEAKDNIGWTVLHIAANTGYEAVVQLLLEKGADIEAKSGNGQTVLQIAAENGYEAIILLLLEKGADIEAKNNSGRTALYKAAENGHETVVELLLEKGADIKAKDNIGWTALHIAANKGHETVVQLMLEKREDNEVKDNNGRTALHIAANNRHEAVMQLLLEEGADVEAKNNIGLTPLQFAANNGHETVVRLLLEKGADVEAKNNIGLTPLQFAANNGHEAVVRLLLEKGADVEAKNEIGLTALYKAATNGHKTVVQLLLENGADIEAKDNSGATALQFAANYGREAIVRLLLEKGADIKAKDNSGVTALQFAADKGHEAVMLLLLEKGAGTKAKDKIGWTAMRRAAKGGHKAVVKLLTSSTR